MATTVQKNCCVCGTDVSQMKRTKDTQGRYYCEPCWAQQRRAAQAKAAGTTASSPATDAGPAVTAKCPRCSAAINAQSRFCPNCGQTLVPDPSATTICHQCRKLVSLEAASCPHCGVPGPFYPADPNRALLMAIRNGDAAMVINLLDNGADVNHNPGEGDEGYTPLDVAEAYRQDRIAQLIRSRGGVRADPNAPLNNVSPELMNTVDQVVDAWKQRNPGGPSSPSDPPMPNTGRAVSAAKDQGPALAAPTNSGMKLAICGSVIVLLPAIVFGLFQRDMVMAAGIVFMVAVLAVPAAIGYGVVVILRMRAARMAPRQTTAPAPNDQDKLKVFIVIAFIVSLIATVASVCVGIAGWFQIDFVMVAAGLAGFLVFLLLDFHLSSWWRQACPACGRWKAAVITDAVLLDRRLEGQTVTRKDEHWSASGDYLGSTTREDQELVTVDTALVGRTCKYCGHQWQSVTELRR